MSAWPGQHFVRGILHPEAFHGAAGQRPFFEGWYVKLVDAEGKRSLSIIPGLFRGEDPDSAHAFVMVVRPDRPWVDYLSFSPQELYGAPDRFELDIEDGRFSSEGVSTPWPELQADLRFGTLEPWPVTRSSPGVMGWYAWVPIMQCYHGIVSLDHELSGTVTLRDQVIDFTGGRGYIEKDWGRSFPQRWVWMQSNHFATEGTCLTISIADVPWFGGAFPGFLVGFWHEGQLRRFTTYTGAKTTLVARTEDGVRFVVEDDTHRLEAHARGGRPVAIHMPSEHSMRGVVQEHLGGTLEARLETLDGTRVFEGVGYQAAWEAHGHIERLRRRSPFVLEDA